MDGKCIFSQQVNTSIAGSFLCGIGDRGALDDAPHGPLCNSLGHIFRSCC